MRRQHKSFREGELDPVATNAKYKRSAIADATDAYSPIHLAGPPLRRSEGESKWLRSTGPTSTQIEGRCYLVSQGDELDAFEAQGSYDEALGGVPVRRIRDGCEEVIPYVGQFRSQLDSPSAQAYRPPNSRPPLKRQLTRGQIRLHLASGRSMRICEAINGGFYEPTRYVLVDQHRSNGITVVAGEIGNELATWEKQS